MDAPMCQLREARREQRRQRQVSRRRRQLTLSSHQEQVALAIWWQTERLLSMAFRYLELQHGRVLQRPEAGQCPGHAGAAASSALSFRLPAEWFVLTRTRVESVTLAEPDTLSGQ